jgi:RHS repeat-associated protein
MTGVAYGTAPDWTNGQGGYPTTALSVTRELGLRHYELSNHLGNVLSTVSDRRLAVASGSLVAYYRAEEKSYADYDPYGMLLPGRFGGGFADQNFGFQGQLKDDQLHGMAGTSYAFEYRVHDPRVGRFLSIDPLSKSYPSSTPYSISANCPILFVDHDGKHPIIAWLIRNASIAFVTDVFVQASVNYIFSENHSAVEAIKGVDLLDAGWNGVTNSIRLSAKYQVALNGGYAVAKGYWKHGSDYTSEQAMFDFLLGGGIAAISDKLTDIVARKGGTFLYNQLKSKNWNAGKIRDLLQAWGFGKDVWHWEADGIVSVGVAREMRGNLIEDWVHASVYTVKKGFTQTPYSNKMVDFVSDNLDVSVKSVKSMDASWYSRMTKHVDDLVTYSSSNGPTQLDVRYNANGYDQSLMDRLIEYGENRGINVVKEAFK